MASLIRVEGYEHGVATPTTNGAGICDAVTGSPTIQGTTKRSGSYALRIYTASAATQYLGYTIAGNPTAFVGRVYFMYHTAPSAVVRLMRFLVVSGSAPAIYFDPADNKIYPYIATAGTKSTALSADTWYRIDWKVDCGSGTTTLDIQLEGVDIPQKTYSQTATSFNGLYVGFIDAVTGEAFYDDLVYSVTSGDYPIGAGEVVGLSPDSDGTHNAGTNVIEANDGTDIGATTAYNKVNSVPIGDATTYIKQVATGTGNYAEVLFANTSKSSPKGAMAYLAYKSSGTQANQGACIIIDEDSTVTEVWGNPTTRADYSESSNFYKNKILPTPAGGWDQAAVNALKARVGYSNDISPVPYWLDLMIQVEVESVTSIQLTVDNATHDQSVEAVGLTQHNILSVDGATHAHSSANLDLIQHNILTVAGATHDQSAGTLTVVAHDPATLLVIQDSTHAQSVESVVITQHNILTVAGAEHAQSASGVGLTQHNILEVAGASHAQSVENVGLIQHNILTVANSTHAQSVENIGLIQHHLLTVANAAHAQSVENVVITQHNILSVNNADHLQTAEMIGLGVMLVVANSTHDQSVENVGLIQHHLLSIADATHLQGADNVTVVYHTPGGVALIVANSTHAQSVENVGITQHNILSVNNAEHTQTADAVGLGVALFVANAIHDQSVENVGLIQHHLLSVNNAEHLQTADQITLITLSVTLVVADCIHEQTVENVILIAVILLTSKPRKTDLTGCGRSIDLTTGDRDIDFETDITDVDSGSNWDDQL